MDVLFRTNPFAGLECHDRAFSEHGRLLDEGDLGHGTSAVLNVITSIYTASPNARLMRFLSSVRAPRWRAARLSRNTLHAASLDRDAVVFLHVL